ncbi:SET domain-containing protein 4 isoform X2 [Odocoileus virginianus]|uniref:SET domain-containing protein 4 isoform X2 n=1 Tax=Odocoileus virginianus TaxID=9874 RepID=A0ABM4I5F7_ODOVR
MKNGGGRTSRIRRRKLFRSSESRGGTGRGLMSKTALREGQTVISLPASCLLTTDTVIRSYLGAYIAKWQPPPSPLLALCTFLVSEKHAGDRSSWKPYLEVLPKAYTCPVCLEPEVVDLLPSPLKAKAWEQRSHVWEFFSSSRGFFSSLQPLFSEAVESIFSYCALRWAWCTVNTRAVYMKRPPRLCLSPEPDTCALAPYLDLLNHSPDVQVKAAFNEETRCYEIRTAARCGRHKEVFICYGPHDNHRLLLEYGFVSIRNPHACVYVSKDMLVKYLLSTDKQMNKKISILEDHDFIENLTFGWDGPSWRLLTALKLLCLEAEELWMWLRLLVSQRTVMLVKLSFLLLILRIPCFLSTVSASTQDLHIGRSTCWKKVLLGEIISDTNEKTSLDVAQKICRYFIEETNAVLQKVSRMKDEEVALMNQLTLVETLRTEELKILQASAKVLITLQTAFT